MNREVISLKKYWEDPGQNYALLLRVTSLVLDGIALHTISGDPEERLAFQETIRRLQRELETAPDPAGSLLVTAGAITQCFESYNRNVHRQFSAQTKELRDMVTLLTDVLRQSCRGNQRTVSSLSEIEKELQEASQLDDIRAVKSRLERCLSSVHTELERQVVESRSAGEVLKTMRVGSMQAVAAEEVGEDQVTGLPGRSQARSCLEALRASSAAYYAIVLVINRLSTVNSRFGYEAGDAYLLEASQMVAQKLRTQDQLFRWSGPALLAVVAREGAAELVNAEVSRIANPRQDCTVALSGRSILIPVSFSSLCLPVWESAELDTLIEQFDMFILNVSAGTAQLAAR